MLILTPNPCLDITLWVNRLEVGSVHRAGKNETTAGGKGVNVARASSRLGKDAHLILMLPSLQSEIYKSKLASENIRVSYLDIAGEVRKAIIINQNESSKITVVNGVGPQITSSDWDNYCNLVIENTHENEFVLLMGSMPASSPEDAIEKLAKKIHAVGAQLLVDTSPLSIKSRKNEILDFITPNLEEAEALISGDDGSLFLISDENFQERAITAAKKLQGVVAKQVFITVGEHGCAFSNGSQSWFLPAFKLNPVLYKSAVGAGDSFVAGLACYLSENSANIDWQECARFAMATAASSCESFLAGDVNKDRAMLIMSGKS